MNWLSLWLAFLMLLGPPAGHDPAQKRLPYSKDGVEDFFALLDTTFVDGDGFSLTYFRLPADKHQLHQTRRAGKCRRGGCVCLLFDCNARITGRGCGLRRSPRG